MAKFKCHTPQYADSKLDLGGILGDPVGTVYAGMSPNDGRYYMWIKYENKQGIVYLGNSAGDLYTAEYLVGRIRRAHLGESVTLTVEA